MEKLISLIIGVAAMLATAHAQDTNAEIKSAVLSFAQNVESNRTISVALYPTFAPGIASGRFGFGAVALCPASIVPGLSDSPIAQHAFAGLRFDMFAGQAFASTVALGVRGNFQIKGHDLEIFAHSGVNIPFSGFGLKNGDIGAMAGGGVYTTLWKPSANVSIGLFGSGEKWTQFSGFIIHGGPVLNWKF